MSMNGAVMMDSSNSSDSMDRQLLQSFSCDADSANDHLSSESNLGDPALMDLIQKNMKLLELLRNWQQKKTKQCAQSRDSREVAQKKEAKAYAMRKKTEKLLFRNMEKIMQRYGCRGFVFGLVSENGEVVSCCSENLRAWWEEKVKFSQNAPAAIERFNALEHNVSASSSASVSSAESDNRKSNTEIVRR